jgi:hypothetical protein
VFSAHHVRPRGVVRRSAVGVWQGEPSGAQLARWIDAHFALSRVFVREVAALLHHVALQPQLGEPRRVLHVHVAAQRARWRVQMHELNHKLLRFRTCGRVTERAQRAQRDDDNKTKLHRELVPVDV